MLKASPTPKTTKIWVMQNAYKNYNCMSPREMKWISVSSTIQSEKVLLRNQIRSTNARIKGSHARISSIFASTNSGRRRLNFDGIGGLLVIKLVKPTKILCPWTPWREDPKIGAATAQVHDVSCWQIELRPLQAEICPSTTCPNAPVFRSTQSAVASCLSRLASRPKLCPKDP